MLTFVTVQLWHRFRERLWRRVVQAGLVPVTVGLVGAGAALLAASTTHGWITGAITLLTAAVLVLTKVHPLAMLAVGTIVGAILG